MKKFLGNWFPFLGIISGFVIYLYGLGCFFEFIVNREVGLELQIIISILCLVFSIGFIRMLVLEAIKFLLTDEKEKEND
jgi:hypothetical protein